MPVPHPPAPGILGPHPSSRQALLATPAPAAYGNTAAYGGPPSYGAYGGAPPVYDPALLFALHATPSPSAYNGGGDWYMDTGAAAHMASNPGILSRAAPYPFSSRIMVGDGSSLPITHHGSSSLLLPSSSLTLNSVLVSPSLIKNICSVRLFPILFLTNDRS